MCERKADPRHPKINLTAEYKTWLIFSINFRANYTRERCNKQLYKLNLKPLESLDAILSSLRKLA